MSAATQKNKHEHLRKKIVYRDRVVQQDDGEGNWLVSYADMMTLLFGFFVILSAFSTPSASKFEKLKESTAKAMKVKYENPNETLAHVFEVLLKSSPLENEVNVVKTDGGITIIMKGTQFFESGSSVLKPDARVLIDKIGGILVNGAKTLMKGTPMIFRLCRRCFRVIGNFPLAGQVLSFENSRPLVILTVIFCLWDLPTPTPSSQISIPMAQVTLKIAAAIAALSFESSINCRNEQVTLKTRTSLNGKLIQCYKRPPLLAD